MGAATRQKFRKKGWFWYFRPEDTTTGSGCEESEYARANLAGCLKSGLWIAVSILAGLVIGQF